VAKAWGLLQNGVVLAERVMRHLMVTPFSHKDSNFTITLATMSWALVEMLKTVRKEGINHPKNTIRNDIKAR
jgi:hypothetical protein